MRFTSTDIPGAHLIDLEPVSDERGFFARSLCLDEFGRHGLNGHMVQQSISWNPRAGTLRGLHYQASSHAEDKLVRVTRGAIFDVIVDLRDDSPARGRWLGYLLSADNRRQIYIPKGVAHGFQTVEDDAEVLYQMTVPFHPEAQRGLRWDDPTLAIAWPLPELVRREGRISPRDLGWPTLSNLDSPR